MVWEKRWFALRVVIVDLGYFSKMLFTLYKPIPLFSPLLECPLSKMWLTSTFSDFILFSMISTSESSLFMKTTVNFGLIVSIAASIALSQRIDRTVIKSSNSILKLLTGSSISTETEIPLFCASSNLADRILLIASFLMLLSLAISNLLS